MARKRKQVKQFSGYIEGDDELRKQIFKNKPASQQVIFELFSHLDHLYYGFFQFFCSIPSSGFWDLLTSRISAAASVADRNRNFCENYAVLEEVTEIPSDFKPIRSKISALVGVSHGMWFALSDPEYSERPDGLALWTAFHETNPSRVVWEWWLDQKCAEAKKILKENNDLQDPHVVNQLEDWAQDSLGLHKPRSHWWAMLKHLLETCEEVKRVKDRIANPYLRLVYTVTKGIAAYNQPDQFCDTYAIGCTGLMRSIAKYAPSMSLAFPTFAEREIRYEIYYQLSNYNIISLPHRTWQKYRKFEELRNEYHRHHGKELTLQEFAEIFRFNMEEVYEVYSQVGMQNPTSLDQALYIDEDNPHVDVEVTLKDKLEDPQIKELGNLFDDQEVLLLALKRIPSKLRKFFIYSYNLCELVHDDLRPDTDELTAFFVNQTPTERCFSSHSEKTC